MPALDLTMSISLSVLILVSILGVHLIYQLFILIGLLRIPGPKNPDKWPGASIIIAARNEFQNLQTLVPKLMEQDYPDFEIVIVNDRSDDNSFDYLMTLKGNPLFKIVFVDHLPDHINSKKYALTLGIKAAKNDILLLTDADCSPSSIHWIQNMVSAYDEKTKIILGYSPYMPETGLLNSLIRFETQMTGILYLSFASNKLPYMGVGRNLSYRKQFFMEQKGFNGFQELTGGDDDLFVNKKAVSGNTGIVLSPESVTYSIPKKSLREYIQQKIRHLSIGKHIVHATKFYSVFSLPHIF